MAYKIFVSSRAQHEIIKDIDFYLERSEDAPSNFIIQLEKCYSYLEGILSLLLDIKILEV